MDDRGFRRFLNSLIRFIYIYRERERTYNDLHRRRADVYTRNGSDLYIQPQPRIRSYLFLLPPHPFPRPSGAAAKSVAAPVQNKIFIPRFAAVSYFILDVHFYVILLLMIAIDSEQPRTYIYIVLIVQWKKKKRCKRFPHKR